MGAVSFAIPRLRVRASRTTTWQTSAFFSSVRTLGMRRTTTSPTDTLPSFAQSRLRHRRRLRMARLQSARTAAWRPIRTPTSSTTITRMMATATTDMALRRSRRFLWVKLVAALDKTARTVERASCCRHRRRRRRRRRRIRCPQTCAAARCSRTCSTTTSPSSRCFRQTLKSQAARTPTFARSALVSTGTTTSATAAWRAGRTRRRVRPNRPAPRELSILLRHHPRLSARTAATTLQATGVAVEATIACRVERCRC